MYTLYGFPKTRSMRVAWALEELGVEYDYQLVDLKAGAHLKPAFTQLNPIAKIPLLMVEQAAAISECGAILSFLADQHPESELIPAAGTLARGRYDEWMYFLATELEQPLWNMAKHKFALPEAVRLAGMTETAMFEWKRAYEAFVAKLGNSEYLLDDTFSMADITACQLLGWAKSMGIAFPDETVSAYLTRTASRDAYRAAWQREAAELAASQG